MLLTYGLEIHTSCSKPLNLGDRFGAFEVFGIDRTGEGYISFGGQVEYQYKVTAGNNSGPVVITSVVDTKLGNVLNDSVSLAPGEMITLFKTATLLENSNNTVMVTGELQNGLPVIECAADGNFVTVEIAEPPTGPFECKKPLDQLTMIWDGTEAIRIEAFKGKTSDPLLADVDNIAVGDEVTVTGFAGKKDVIWKIFKAGTSDKLGESKFHLSCSDADMNGVEDCGKRQGDGKKNEASLINDWLLEGIVGASSTLDCTPMP